VVLVADAKIEIAERQPDPLAAPPHMDHLALERHGAAKGRACLGRQLIFKPCVELKVAGVDNKLAHPMGLQLLKANDEIAAAPRRGKNILENILAPSAAYTISRQNPCARPSALRREALT
jgi:hypothetical protein